MPKTYAHPYRWESLPCGEGSRAIDRESGRIIACVLHSSSEHVDKSMFSVGLEIGYFVAFVVYEDTSITLGAFPTRGRAKRAAESALTGLMLHTAITAASDKAGISGARFHGDGDPVE